VAPRVWRTTILASRASALFLVFTLAIVVSYLPYSVFEDWWYLALPSAGIARAGRRHGGVDPCGVLATCRSPLASLGSSPSALSREPRACALRSMLA
jgi:hypothetical protein